MLHAPGRTHRVRWRRMTQAEGGRENWCGVLQEVALPGAALAAPAAFLPAAAAFANDECYGNLSCSLFVHPRVRPLPPASRISPPPLVPLALHGRTACTLQGRAWDDLCCLEDS